MRARLTHYGESFENATFRNFIITSPTNFFLLFELRIKIVVIDEGRIFKISDVVRLSFRVNFRGEIT